MRNSAAIERFRTRLTSEDLEFVWAYPGSNDEGRLWIVTALVRGVVTTRHVRILGETFSPEVVDEAAERYRRAVLG